MTNITRYRYLLLLLVPLISLPEIYRVILYTIPGKALGLDSLLNQVLQQVLPIIKLYLDYIFNQYLQVGYYPKHFYYLNIVVLCKLGKGDYTNLKNYQLIAFLSTINKALELIITLCISYLIKQYIFLFQNYIRGCRGYSCKYTLYLL